jgi:integrase
MSNSNRIPGYRKHKQSGSAVVTLSDGFGRRRDILLGEYGTSQSRREYARIIAEWEANGNHLPEKMSAGASFTVNELILAFWRYAEQSYRRPDGSPSRELLDYKYSLRLLKELYGATHAVDFGPLALQVIQQEMIKSDLCRGVINQRIGRIRRVFKWGVANQHVPAQVLQALQAVSGLRRGRSAARETESVKPVPEIFVEAALPFMRPPVAAMVRLQLLTGMRPGEVVVMRTIDLDQAGKVWLYTPGSDRGPCGEHKTAWRGHRRLIAIGPRGQAILRPFLKTDLFAFLFSPAETMAALRSEQRANRKTPIQPSQQDRRKRRPKKRPGERYTVRSYGQAIKMGCRKADIKAHQEDRNIPAEHVVIPGWHPNQLRHTKATEIRREAGLDAARVVLGHRSPQITETYAEIDVNKAAEVMARLG